MDKVDEERSILKLASPLLEELYGRFDVVAEQLDKPDAAIILQPQTVENKLTSKDVSIGIEITSIDKQQDKQYLNDEKFTKDLISKQIQALQKGGRFSSPPTKKISIQFTKDYIFNGVFKKQNKHTAYAQAGDYDEIIILAFSSYLDLDYPYFSEYHTPWTEFLLSEQKFPFNKVIFVCTKTKKSVLIYDKSRPQLNHPQDQGYKEAGITIMHGSVSSFDKETNIEGTFNHKPLMARSKNKTSKANKK